MTSSTSTQQIAIAVVLHAANVLIGLRPPGVPLAGLWEFPGGKVLSGESAAKAAIRECLEETGLAVEVVAEFPTATHDYPHGRLELHFLRCIPLNPGQVPAAPFRWVPLAELDRYEFPPANARLLAILRDSPG